MTIIHKTVAERDGLDFVMSDESVDRYGDVIVAAGWDLRHFKSAKNPIALFAHDGTFPIGNWENVRVDGKKLIGTLKLAARGTSQRIDELISLVEQGVLRAVSVGFRPLAAEPMDKDKPYGAQKYTRSELLECSLVAVPANPSALAVAKQMGISDDTVRMAFGEQAATTRRDLITTGEQAETTFAETTVTRAAPTPRPKDSKMTTLSQRIENAQNELTAKRDALAGLTAADNLDVDAIEALTDQIEAEERSVAALKASEAKIGLAVHKDSGLPAPAVQRRPLGTMQKELSGLDLLVRRALVFGVSEFGGKSIDQVLEERYPGHEATAMVVKADQTIATTSVSGWVSELMQTSYQGFLDALRPRSIFPGVRDRGLSLNFDAAGTAYIPGLTAGGANGSFFGEGAPIRVGRITTNGQSVTPRKMGVIIPFTREAAKRSTPSLESLIRRAIVADTAKVLDQAFLDNAASSSIRPAGILNGVSAVSSGYGGGDYQSVIADIAALLAPFDSADASDGGITLIMNPAQARKLAMMPGPDGTFGWADRFMSEFTIARSTSATAARLIAIRDEDIATAMGDVEFEVSNQATIHMEDSTPLEIVSGTGPTTADPVRSFYQTDSMGIRMVMDVTWKLLRSGSVQWIDGTSW